MFLLENSVFFFINQKMSDCNLNVTVCVSVCVCESHSVGSDSLQSQGLYSLWSSLGQNTRGVAFPFSRGSSHPWDGTHVSHIAGGFVTSWATREAPVLLSPNLMSSRLTIQLQHILILEVFSNINITDLRTESCTI